MFIGQVDEDADDMGPVPVGRLVVVDGIQEAPSLDLEVATFPCQRDGVGKEHPACVSLTCIKGIVLEVAGEQVEPTKTSCCFGRQKT